MGSTEETHNSMGEIAVIGLSCRFPGGATTPAKFWELLSEKKSAYSEAPASRYSAKGFHHPADKINTLSSTGGHFLEGDVAAFDAPFFNITAQEAKAMDPTARMLLEVTYEAFENSGLPIEDLVGSQTSCYVGCFTRDYHEMLMRDAETSPMYAGTGTGFSLLSNRISWFYDLRGPSMTLDTACSSSLVGLHLACQGLRTGESKVAVVSGANLILSPDLAMWLSNLHMTSKDGLSRSFADGTTGYGRGEGIATLILKPLADALRDGDPIRSVIRGTGVNQDGHTTGITLPNSEAQADLIRSTYHSAGLDFSRTGYFEAHGTGTAVGDPLELGAVAKTLASVRDPGDELFVGSVKSNIGHLEGAAGLAGVIKCILMLESGTILPNIHFDKPNRRIPFKKWKICVPTTLLPWPSDRLMRASVNSFGYGGTNAHAILDDAGEFLAQQGLRDNEIADFPVIAHEKTSRHQRLLVFSARDEAALDRMRIRYGEHLERLISASKFQNEADESAYLDKISFTLSDRRSRFDWKAHVSASSIKELRDVLTKSKFTPIHSTAEPRIGFIFTGQGAQWARMGLELLQYPVFKASVSDADTYLKDVLGSEWSVLEELQRDEKTSTIQRAKISQPICTVLQVALVDLLQTWNVKASAVVGHSSGEIGAAYCYGAITREDAWRISYFRGKICSELHDEAPELKGSMMAAGLSPEDAQKYIVKLTQGKVVVACVNSPSSVTISGDEAGIDELSEILKTDSVFCRKLKVENAYHSHHMQLIAEKYHESIAGFITRIPPTSSLKNMKMASSVTGDLATHADFGPEYWIRNLVSPVLFSNAVEALSKNIGQRRRRAKVGESALDFLLEIGPHAALKGPLRQILQHQSITNFTYRSMLLRGEDAAKTAVETAGILYCHGARVIVPEVSNFATSQKPLTDLPSYPWNHSLTYWSESRLSQNYRSREHGRHDLLGAVAIGSDEMEPKWRHFLRTSDNPWIRDHVVQSSILYPGAGIIAMPIEAARKLADEDKEIDKIILRDVQIHKAIVINDDQEGVETFLHMRRQNLGPDRSWTGWWEFSVTTRIEDQDLQENGSGLVKVTYKSDRSQQWTTGRNLDFESLKRELSDAKEKCIHRIEPKDFYNATAIAGLQYGPSFQGLTELYTGKDYCHCVISISDTKHKMPAQAESSHLIHPTTLDVIFHSLFAALGEDGLEFKNAAVPIAFESLSISADLPSGAGSRFSGFCHATRSGSREVVADIFMSDMKWDEAKVQVKGIRCRELPRAETDNSSVTKAPCGTLVWKPDIDFLDADTLPGFLSEQYSGNAEGLLHGNGKFSSKKSILKMVELAAHKNPNLSVLQVGDVASEFTNSIISTLASGHGSIQLFSKYILADVDRKAIETAEELFQNRKLKLAFATLDENLDLKEQDVPTNSTDLLLLFIDVGSTVQRQQLLSGIRRVLKPGGYVIALMSKTNGALVEEVIDLEKQTTETDYLSLLLSGSPKYGAEESASNPESLVIARKYVSAEVNKLPETVFILTPHSPSHQVITIVNEFTKMASERGMQAQKMTWPPQLSETQSHSVISLLELETSFIAEVSFVDFSTLKTLVLQSSRMLWVSRGCDPVMNAAVGYLRSVKNENPNLNLQYLRLEDQLHQSFSRFADVILKVAATPTIEREFVEIEGRLCINRWVADEGMSRALVDDQFSVPHEHMAIGESLTGLELAIGNPKELDSWYFDSKRDSTIELKPNEVEIEVKAIGLNARDLIAREQKYNSPDKELSGFAIRVGSQCTRIQPGDRVCAIGTGSYSTTYRVDESLCHQIPLHANFEEASCWPITYGAAYHALLQIAKLKSENTVLVQAAASAIGQAAVQLAQAVGANVYAMVRTAEEFNIMESFDLPKDHIFGDNDQDLAADIKRLTQGKGFDIILNQSLAGDAFRQLWLATASHGIFIDASRADVSNEAVLSIAPFQRGASYHIMNTDSIFLENPSLASEIMKDTGSNLRKFGIQPTTTKAVFAANQVGKAFAHLQSHGNVGRTIVTFNHSDQVPISPNARNTLILDSTSTYIIAGGLGGLGQSLAWLLIEHGAKFLVFLSRSGAKSTDAQKFMAKLAISNVVAKSYACNISDEGALKGVLQQCSEEMPPIKGIIQSAAVLNDSVYENMTHEMWQGAIRPKIQGTRLLHGLLPKDMDFFVMLSSISGVVGNRSQANYAAGNTFQDALAQHRRERGLPAVSIDLGLMLDIGLIAQRGGSTNLKKSEAVGLYEHEFHAIVTAAIAGSYGQSETPTQLITGLPTGGILRSGGLEEPFYYDDPRFSLLKKSGLDDDADDDAGTSGGSSAEASFISQLPQCGSLQEASSLISHALCARLARSLQTAPENIDSGKPLHTYGVDSLMAVDFRTWILIQIKAEISLFDVLSGGSIEALASKIAAISKLVPVGVDRRGSLDDRRGSLSMAREDNGPAIRSV